MQKITIINGPNLTLLGKREPEIYGDKSFETYFQKLKEESEAITLDYLQSNIEGEIVDFIQHAGFKDQGIILNAGAYTHTSIAIGDAVAAVPAPVIEVHISNVYNREKFRHSSFISPHAAGIIVGMGLHGYKLAMDYLIKLAHP